MLSLKEISELKNFVINTKLQIKELQNNIDSIEKILNKCDTFNNVEKLHEIEYNFQINKQENNWTTFIECEKISYDNIKILCKHFDFSYDQFNDLLIKNKSLLAGGSALWCTKPFCELKDFNGDLDIFVPSGTPEILPCSYINSDWKQINSKQHPKSLIHNIQYPSYNEKFYKEIPNVLKIATWENTSGCKLQFIYLTTQHVKAHIRSFDMSICQVFYNGKFFGINKKYKHLTYAGFNKLLKPVSITEDHVFYSRIMKYKQRGFIPFSDKENHVTCDDILKSKYMEIKLPNLKIIIDPIKQINEIINFYSNNKTKTKESLDMITEVITSYSKQETRMGYPFKQACENLFNHIFPNLLLTDENRNMIYESFTKHLVKVKDIRWILLYMEQNSCLFNMSQDEYNQAKQTGIARDNLIIIKNLIKSTIDRD